MAKIQRWLPWLALGLILIGQLNYFPDRIFFFKQTLAFVRADSAERLRLAYGAADYDLLAWVGQHISPETTLLLLTASPQTYGDPSYVLYHRAIYHLSPRPVWWAAPVAPARYPAWWSFTDLTPQHILHLAETRPASVILADGFSTPPISGEVRSYDEDTHLIFLSGEAPTVQSPSLSSASLIEICQETFGFCRLFIALKMLGASLSILAWGDLLYRWLEIGLPTPSTIRRLAMGWLWGCGLTSIATFILLWLGWSLFTSVVSLSILGILLWFFGPTRPQRRFAKPLRSSEAPLRSSWSWSKLKLCPTFPTLNPLTILFFIILLLQSGWIFFVALISPLTDWDAWVNWASKANLIFSEQTISPNLYHNLARLPTNMDYPLMLPLLETWFYTWLGQIYEPVVGLISFLFYLALVGLFYEALRSQVSAITALGLTTLLAITPRLERPAHSGLADIPLAGLVLLAFLLLFYGYNQGILGQKSRFMMGLGFSIGLLPWLKNEGWLWWGLIILFSLGQCSQPALDWRRVTDHAVSEMRLYFQGRTLCVANGLIFFLFLALSLPLLWQFFLATHGTYHFTFLPLTLSNFLSNLPRLPLIWLEMTKRLLNPYWNFIWLLVGGMLLLRRERVFQRKDYVAWLILPVMGYLFLMSLTYVFSRFDPYLAHLNNSVERLLLQATPLAWWWLVGQSVSLGWLKSNQQD